MRRAAALLGLALLVVACTGDGEGARPGPTTEAGPTTSLVDRSGVVLAGVPGATTSTIVEKGSAVLTGVVEGPVGAVAGATVRVERLVADRDVRTDVVTGTDGRFRLEGVPGGRYRVRAFQAPTLAQTDPEVRFLEDGEEHDFRLVVEEHAGLVVRADAAPEPPALGGAVNVVVLVATRSVGTDGVVRAEPVVGAEVELGGLGRWVLRSDGSPVGDDDVEGDDDDTGATTSSTFLTTTTTRPAISATARTDDSGQARFQLRCVEPGTPGLYLLVPVRVAPPAGAAAPVAPEVTRQSTALDLPACVGPASAPAATESG